MQHNWVHFVFPSTVAVTVPKMLKSSSIMLRDTLHNVIFEYFEKNIKKNRCKNFSKLNFWCIPGYSESFLSLISDSRSVSTIRHFLFADQAITNEVWQTNISERTKNKKFPEFNRLYQTTYQPVKQSSYNP